MAGKVAVVYLVGKCTSIKNCEMQRCTTSNKPASLII